jgi:hypothetical protein
VPVYDYSTPYDGPYQDKTVLENWWDNLSPLEIAKYLALGIILPGMLTPQQKAQFGRKGYGPIDPVEWGKAGQLVNPGANPGWLAGDFVKPAYETTNPYQSKFYWGKHPYVDTATNRDVYNQTQPYAGTQGFGLQAGPAQYDTNQLLNQINQTALDPNFVGYSQYPLPGYVAPGPVVPQAYTGPTMPVPPVITPGFNP